MKYFLSSQTDFTGERVLVRAGFDVPITNGVIVDSSRIDAVVPTIQYITSRGGIVILVAHQGRPEGRNVEDSQLSLLPELELKLGHSIHFLSDLIDDLAQSTITSLSPGSVVLLENVRFYAEETSKNSSERLDFAKKIAKLGTMYCNEAFTNCHRQHASMFELAQLLPSFVGLQLEQEIKHLDNVFETAEHPITLIVAGAKIETKVPVISHFLTRGDSILVGGVIANTFLAAKGCSLGSSRIDSDAMTIAQELLKVAETSNASIFMPTDVLTASSADSHETSLQSVPFTSDIAFDIGKETIESYSEILRQSKTIIWNGPVGMYENELFSYGSRELANAVVEATVNGATSIIGGGDTIDMWHQYDLPLDQCSFVSMGGGAMLSYISGESMPALTALDR